LDMGSIDTFEFTLLESGNLNKAFDFEARLVPVTKAEVMIIVRDVTKQKQAQLALRESEQNFSNIFQKSNDGIYINDVDGNFLNVNDKLIEQIGYSKKEFLKMNIVDLIPKELEATTKVIFKQMQKDRSIKFEFEMITKDGLRLPIEVSANYFPVGDKEMVQGMVRDISARKKNEEKLKNNEYQLRQILESMPIGVYILNSKGTPYYANQMSKSILGKGILPVDGISELADVYKAYKADTDEVYPSDELPIVKALAGETVYADDLVIHRESDVIDLEAWATPVYDTENKLAFAIAVFNDITQRKAAEELRNELTSEVEATNKELSEFAYIVSHDLKAPLRGIATLSSWLLSEHRENLNEEGQEYIDLIANRVDRMNALIDGILQYSKIGRTKENIEILDLNQLIAEIVDLIADHENVEVKVQSEMPQIQGNKVRIGQVFQNLISNAIKHNDKPKVKINVTCEPGEKFWKFAVTDNGPGIDKKFHDKIFEVFRTLKSKDEVESTGIGLSLVKKIIELHGGNIKVDSNQGKGTSFVFELPKTVLV